MRFLFLFSCLFVSLPAFGVPGHHLSEREIVDVWRSSLENSGLTNDVYACGSWHYWWRATNILDLWVFAGYNQSIPTNYLPGFVEYDDSAVIDFNHSPSYASQGYSGVRLTNFGFPFPALLAVSTPFDRSGFVERAEYVSWTNYDFFSWGIFDDYERIVSSVESNRGGLRWYAARAAIPTNYTIRPMDGLSLSSNKPGTWGFVEWAPPLYNLRNRTNNPANPHVNEPLAPFGLTNTAAFSSISQTAQWRFSPFYITTPVLYPLSSPVNGRPLFPAGSYVTYQDVQTWVSRRRNLYPCLLLNFGVNFPPSYQNDSSYPPATGQAIILADPGNTNIPVSSTRRVSLNKSIKVLDNGNVRRILPSSWIDP